MKNKQFFLLLAVVALLTFGITAGVLYSAAKITSPIHAESVAIKSVSQDITASGSVHSQNEATLHFQTGGKVVYLPFKEGDSVVAGQTIVALDQRTIADNLQNAVKTTQNQQISFDAVNDFNGNRDLSDTGLNTSARRQLQTAVNTLDQAKIAVEIQKIAQEQAYLTSPISGIITHQDISTANVNVTPTTSFSVADPTTKVFRATVNATDIDFVSVGSTATVHIDGTAQTLSGTVEKIYPQKITLASGEDVYQVDIQATGLSNTALFGQSGSVTIKSNNQTQAQMVPTWTLLGHNSLWVLENGKATLKKITIGKVHSDMTEVTSGLSADDKVIVNPEKVAKEDYSVL